MLLFLAHVPLKRRAISLVASTALSVICGLQCLKAQDAPLLNWSEDAFTDYVQVLNQSGFQTSLEELLVDESPKSLAKGDFNHSGYEDIIIFRNDPAEPKTIISLANYGPEGLWLFDPPSSLALTSMMTSNHTSARGQFSKGIVDDFNQDGWLDMVWVGDHGHESKFKLNKGEGIAGSSDWAGFLNYTLSMIPPAAANFIDGASGDINGDGLPDVILHSRGGGEQGYGNDMVLINVNGTSFQDETELWLGARQRTAAGSNIALADCDGDGDLDIIKSSLETPIYPWYQTGVFVGFNDGDSFTNWMCLTTEIEDATGFNVADFDADGKDDVYIVGDEHDGWYRQVAGGENLFEFLPITHFPAFGSGGRIAAGDVDLDGLLDVVVSGVSEPSCSDAVAPYLFQFDGSSFSNAQGTTGIMPWQSDFFDAAIVDLDGDGMNDLLLAGCQGMALHFNENCDLFGDDTDSDGDGMYDVCDPCPFNSSATCEETHEMPIISDHGSIARQWNEMLLASIRHDFSRPTVHARNLFHTSAAMWDAWANFAPEAIPYLYGNDAGLEGFLCGFEDFPIPSDPEATEVELNKAIAFAMCRILEHRFVNAPGWPALSLAYPYLLEQQGYDPTFTGEDYSTGDGRALGNAIAACYIAYGLQDGSNEANDYASQSYLPSNPPTVFSPYSFQPFPAHINRWQPLTFAVFEDQSANIIESFTPPFVTPEWGSVNPFSLTEEQASYQERAGYTYRLFLDPGAPPAWSSNSAFEDDEWAYAHTMTALWSGHLDATDGVMWDISPGGIGNRPGLPTNFEEAKAFYNFYDGGTTSPGHPVNPKTGLGYEPNVVPRGDYTRVLAEFWADGPDSETPPGHWFTILNVVSDNPDLERRLFGVGEPLDELEWDVKAYFTLGGAMHDAAVSTWSAKGWYDTARPYSAIRSMATLGQRTDPTQPRYNGGGLPLIEDYIELQEQSNGHFYLKMKAWNNYCDNDWVSCNASEAWGVDWIYAKSWRPYQRSTFVTPPFAGYLSGHSTFSRAAAEVLTQLTGDAFFPGGMGEFEAPADDFLVFEPGPSQPITLQWATYRDAADESGLSRIWGGIHPFFDDYKARENGRIIGLQVAQKAKTYFVGQLPGCMDVAACNFDPLATVEAGCLYGTSYFVPSVFGQPVITPCIGLEVPEGYTSVDSECFLFAVAGQDQCYMNWSTACHEALEACLNEELGCTDPLACNFDATATYDVGDCEAAEMWLIPDVLTGLPALPFCGSLDEIPSGYSIGQFGCVQSVMDSDNQCLTNWGSTCQDEYESCVVPGCTLFLACNYDASANFNDGSCIMPGTPCNDYDACTVFSFYGPNCNCTGPILDLDDDGVCDGADCAPNHPEWPDAFGNCPEVGCTDITACNYDASAEVDNGSCEEAVHWLIPDVVSGGPAIPWCADLSTIPAGYSVGLFECVASVVSNDSYCIVTTWDGICQSAYEACLNPGCTNEAACNFNPNSNLDDGSCIIAGTPCEDYNYCTPSSFWSDNCECEGIMADSDNDGVCDYSDCAPLNPYQPNALGVCIDLHMGCTDVNACNYDPEAILDDGSCSGTMQWIIPLVPGSGTPALQWCTEDTLPEGYELAEQTCAAMVIANDDFCIDSFWDAICQAAYEACLDLGGCLNSVACNFDPSAQYDDGSCVFQGDACITEGVCTGDGSVNAYCECEESIVDSDGDGICDALEISGCTEENAVNYNPLATDDDGGCFIPGCKEWDACNYNPMANMDDGSCAYPGMPCFVNPCFIESYWNDECECSGYYIDEDNDGVCIGEDCDDANPDVPQFIACAVFFGCTNPIACNFAPEAMEDDGSCILPQGWFIPMNGVTGSAIPICTDADEVPEGYLLAEAFCMEFILFENPSCLLGTWSSLSACSAVYNECAAEVGCMDETASNYDPSATFNDPESCEFLGCTSQDAFNYDPQATVDDGSCEPIILGCTNTEAFNFDALANVDDDSCILPVYGCIDSSAMNYNQAANVDDGSCQYALGCTDPTALNYDPIAQYDDASCMYSEDDVAGCISPFALNYNPDADYNDGSCIFESLVPGCTDPSACNYTAGAYDDDGSCVYDGPACACAFDIAFDTDTLGPLELTTFTWEGSILGGLELIEVDIDFTPVAGGNYASDLIVGICDPNGNCLEFGGYNSTLGYNNVGGFPFDWAGGQAGFYATAFDVSSAGLSGDGIWTIELKNTYSGGTSIWQGTLTFSGNCSEPEPVDGCTDEAACNFNPEATADDGSCVYTGTLCPCTLDVPFDVLLGAGETVSGSTFASVSGLLSVTVDLTFAPNSSSNYASDLAIAVCDPIGNCFEIGGYSVGFGYQDFGNFPLTWQVGTGGEFTAEFNVAEAGLAGAGEWTVAFMNDYNNALAASQWSGTITFTGDCDEAIPGCTDETACNYNAAATVDDGSCYYPNPGYDCDGACLTDTDGDGVCDDNEIPGCTDDTADNYDPMATDENGTCVYGPANPGCTNPEAENYDPEATEDDGSCIFGNDEYYGCTDPFACNFDPNATQDDGSCEYDSCLLECMNTWVFDTGELIGNNYVEYVLEMEAGSALDSIVANVTMTASGSETLWDYMLSICDPQGNCAQVGGELLSLGYANETWWDDWPTNYTDTTGTFIADVSAFGLGGAGDWTVQVWFGVPWENVSAQFEGTIQLVGPCGNSDQYYTGCTDPEAFNYDPNAELDNGTCLPPVEGCTDELALNYDPLATISLETCVYTEADYYGCTYADACNYSELAVEDDGTCQWPEACEDCYGSCLDEDMNGICDCFGDGSTVGCMDITALNYNPYATEEGPCEYQLLQGCMDPEACNYDASAEADDYSLCFYPSQPYLDCTGSCINDVDGDGICDELEIVGCTQVTALNWNPYATDEGECEFQLLQGCMDEDACNYDASAQTDDYSLCFYPSQPYLDCTGSCINDLDGDGICDELEIVGCTNVAALNWNPYATDEGECEFQLLQGCMDEEACNYDASAETDDYSLCFYPSQPYLDCTGGCINDTDGDGICDELEIWGCMDVTALNFHPYATDEGECEYPQDLGCMDEEACNYDPFAQVDYYYFSLCVYPSQPYLDCTGGCINDSDGDGVCDELEFVGCTETDALNYNPWATDDDGSCQFAPDPGCTDFTACNYDEGAGVDDGTCEYPEYPWLDCNGDCLYDSNGDGVCDEFEIPGCTVSWAWNYNPYASYDDGSCQFAPDPGCMDFTACNYDEGAGVDDGTCEYPEYPWLDCNGVCLYDSNGDGVCDEFEIPGCTVSWAWNYNPFATYDDGSCQFAQDPGCTDFMACNYDEGAGVDDGTCEYPEYPWFDCNGNCLNDSNGDGLCDEFEIAGCMVPWAWNYNPFATYDDGSCQFAPDPGCTDFMACNYDEGAGVDDGTCEYPEYPWFDCDGYCFNDTDDDGVCDEQEIAGCTDVMALNYGNWATDDDGSCSYALIQGCTYPDALNYDLDADYDDGSCEFAAGPNPCPADLDEDGTVAVSDLLLLLSSYGASCE